MNVSKCNTITFTRRQSSTMFDYVLVNTPLNRVTSIKDLGVVLDSKLRFTNHIAVTTAKAYAMLGFLRRNTANFDNVHALKSLYCALVRSVLEYGIQVWAPHHNVHINRIENVQKRFIRYALRNLPWNDPVQLPPYEQRCALIRLQPLASRRVMLQRLFVFDIIQSNIDCSSLLEHVRLHAPVRQVRNRQLLWIPGHRTDYGQFNPLDFCCRLLNDVCDVFDFNVSKLVFKNRIKNF